MLMLYLLLNQIFVFPQKVKRELLSLSSALKDFWTTYSNQFILNKAHAFA